MVYVNPVLNMSNPLTIYMLIVSMIVCVFNSATLRDKTSGYQLIEEGFSKFGS